jgi:phosphate transport system permease protein
MATALGSPLVGGAIDPSDDLRRSDTPRVRFRTGFDRWMSLLLPLLFGVAIVPILALVYYVSVTAVPTLSIGVLTSFKSYESSDALAVPIISTFELLAVATGISLVLGLFGGVATAEFLSERWASWVRMSANLLAGMPSVIVGYFGFFVFLVYLGWGGALLGGSLTLAFFMTPYVFRTADLAFTSVPRPVREASFGSGSTPLQYILRVGTPIAFPQILTGVFLAMAIGLGETAPIVITVVQNVSLPVSLFSHATYLTALIWVGYGFGKGSLALTIAFQAAFIVVVVVVVLNVVVRLISARFRKRLEGLYQ